MGATSASKAETDLNSVERIVQYLGMDLEAAPDTTAEVAATLPPNWPAQGEVMLSKVGGREGREGREGRAGTEGGGPQGACQC